MDLRSPSSSLSILHLLFLIITTLSLILDQRHFAFCTPHCAMADSNDDQQWDSDENSDSVFPLITPSQGEARFDRAVKHDLTR